MRVFLLLAIFLFSAAYARKRPPPEKIITVSGRLDDLIARRLSAQSQSVQHVDQHRAQSRIEFHGASEELESLLKSYGYDYVIEHNQEITPQVVELREIDVNRKRAISSGAPEDLDYLDNPSGLLDGRYLPPGTGEDIRIYYLDLGVNPNHQELVGRVFRPAFWKDQAPCDSNHGTSVAVAGSGFSYGVSTQSIIYDVKLPEGSDCTFYVSDALDALLGLLDEPAPFIVSMSWKAGVSTSINNVCKQLWEHGAILVAAAGNDNENNGACTISPASTNYTLAVASVGNTFVRSSWSNYGGCINLFAPGEGVTGGTSFSNTGYTSASGTSFSCPKVAGALAVIMKAYHITDPAQATAKLIELTLKGKVQQGGSAPNRLLSFKGSSQSSPSPSPIVGASSSKFSLFY